MLLELSQVFPLCIPPPSLPTIPTVNSQLTLLLTFIILKIFLSLKRHPSVGFSPIGGLGKEAMGKQADWSSFPRLNVCCFTTASNHQVSHKNYLQKVKVKAYSHVSNFLNSKTLLSFCSLKESSTGRNQFTYSRKQEKAQAMSQWERVRIAPPALLSAGSRESQCIS